MVEIVFQREKNRSLALDGEKKVGKAIFVDEGDVWRINKTIVDKEYGGQGIARRLVDKIVEEAEKADKKLSSSCSYSTKVFEGEKYKHLLAE